MDFTMLVNKQHLLPADFMPEDLVDIKEPMGKKLDPSFVNRLNKEAYLYFKMMQLAARQEGYQIFVDSSYRSLAYQQSVYQALVLEKGIEYANKYVAPVGGSEHHTGLAIDIIFMRDGQMIEEQFETDPEIIWLFNNAYKYGYILRYPKGKEDITGFNFEPWHFRYVGIELALKLYQDHLTLEEYHSLKRTL